MRRLLIAIVLVGAASTLALAPPTSRASFAANDRHQDAKRVLSTETVTALSVQPNGKILAGGRRAGVGYTEDPAESGDFALALYQSNGRLDTSFGKGGRVLTDFGSSADWLRAVARQPDGKIVAAGFSTPYKSDVSSFALARYDSRGRLDSTFGRHGKVRVRFGSSGSAAYALALQPDGKIVAVGSSYGGPHPSWVVARFNSNGALDRSFGDGGAVTTVFAAASEAGAVTLDPNGKIVVLGDSCEGEDPWTGCALALARYDVDGTLDPTFGSGGKATTRFAGLDDVVGNGLAVQPDGKIVASGTAGVSTDESDNYDFVLARFDADGSLDSAFGTGGMVTTDFEPGADESYDIARSLALAADGAIAVAGVDSAGEFTVALYDTHGNLDPSFGGTGVVHTRLSGDYDEARAVAFASDGKIVTAGVAREERFVLVRYNRDGTLDQGFGKDGRVFTEFGSPVTILAAFSAADQDRGVLVRWRTAVEVNARGFNVYREQKGHRIRVNHTLMTSKGGSARGASYSFLDKAAPRHGALVYRLQVVKKDGTRVWYGSVVPER